MTDVFISYSRRDKEFVQTLHTALKAHNRDTWVDWEAIPLTTDWWLEIQSGIEEADTFIFVITPDSIASKVCNQEIDYAIRHNKRLMPIVHREVDMTQVHPALAKHNALFFRELDDFDTAFASLLKALDTDLKHVRMHTRLLVRSIEWIRDGRDSSFLLRDRDLELSERWLEQAVDKDPHPTEQQMQYIIASQQLRQQQQAYDASYRRAEQELKRALVYRKPTLRKVLWSSLAVTALLLTARFVGLLQPLELAAYDQLMRLRPSEGQDKRFLIVEVTDADIQNELKEKGTALSDASLDRLLEKLQSYQPRLIGLDLYRDFASKRTSLTAQLRQNNRLYGLCKVAETDAQGTITSAAGTARPSEIAPERVGFSDVLDDAGGIVRRQLLLQDKVFGSKCDAEYAFSLLLAKRYLELEPTAKQQYKKPLPTPGGLGGDDLKLGETVFKRLPAFAGAYHPEDTEGYQILLNYRAYTDPTKGPFDRISLGQMLDGAIAPDRVKDKLVLVGVTSKESVKDYKATPYGSGSQEIPGVVLQAHMTSQLMSAALDQRPLLWVWSQWSEALWILGWSLVGGLLAWRLQHLPLLGAVGVTIVGLTVLCFVVLTQAGWVPLVPSALGLVGTSGLLVYIAYRRPYPMSVMVTPKESASRSANRSS